MRLTKIQRDILDCVSSMPSYSWDGLLSLLPKYSPQDIYSACVALVPEYASTVSPTINGKIAMIVLTHQGKHYRELDRLETKERWKERAWGFICGLALWGVQELILLLTK